MFSGIQELGNGSCQFTGTLTWESVCEVSAVGKISDCQQGGSGFNHRPGRGLNFGRPSFVTPSVDRDVKQLVWPLDVLSGDLKGPMDFSSRTR